MCQDQASGKQAVFKIYTVEMYIIKITFSRVNKTRHMMLKPFQRIGDTPKTTLFQNSNFMAYKII